MGAVAGERLAAALERAAARRVPLVLRTATGGARMQEGMVSLVQMPKLVVARRSLADSGSPLIAVFGNPTTGAVLASLGALADVTIAEAGATVGFAGPRLVEQLSGRPLRSNSHTAESAASAGLVDAIVSHSEVAGELARLLHILSPDDPEADSPTPPLLGPDQFNDESTDAWSRYEEARSPQRARAEMLVAELGASFYLRGDRAGKDDDAVIAAVARVKGRRALVLGLNREMPGPAAYRKARRCLTIAVRLGLPVVTLIDTPGAAPFEDSEAGGIAWEIAALFDALLSAPVPIVAIVTGEGGSGGALAFACADALLAFRGSVFSVIGPELAAQVLWKDPDRAPEAARLQRPSGEDLVRMGIADAVVDAELTPQSLRDVITYHLELFTREELSGRGRTKARQKRWRR